MPNSIDTYVEFVDSNMDKRYPLCDDGSGSTPIPDSFIADLKLTIGITDRVGNSSFRFNTYISSIRVYPDYIYVEISTTDDGIIAISDPIPTWITVTDPLIPEDSTTSVCKTIQLRPTTSIPVNGVIVIGTCEDMAKLPGVINLDYDSGCIFPANITTVDGGISGIRIGDTVLTGDITFKASSDVNIMYNKQTNTITFGVKSGQQTGTSGSTNAVSDTDILNAIESKYGRPVTSVNGFTGDIGFSGEDCCVVTKSDNRISFFNPCGSVCASEEFMENTYERISDLNNNVRVLTEFYNSISGVLAQMGVRVSALLENKQ